MLVERRPTVAGPASVLRSRRSLRLARPSLRHPRASRAQLSVVQTRRHSPDDRGRTSTSSVSWQDKAKPGFTSQAAWDLGGGRRHHAGRDPPAEPKVTTVADQIHRFAVTTVDHLAD